MITVRVLRAAGCVFLAAWMIACAGGRRYAPDTEPPDAMMGVYRARIEQEAGAAQRFRLLLYATLPDRLHGEILSPLGTTELIIDGGGGRVAVTFPRQGVSYAGSGEAEALEKILGLRLSLEELVQGLLGHAGTDPPAYRVERTPEGSKGLPRTLVIHGEHHRLSLKLKKLQPLRVSTAGLGSGEPPPGMELLPLDRLNEVELPDVGGEG